MNYKLVFSVTLFLWISISAFSQKPDQVQVVQNDDEDLANLTYQFENLFFEAITLRAIEKYEQAITKLIQCRNINRDEAAVYVELGKNYEALEQVNPAQENYLKAISLLSGQPKTEVQYNLFESYKNERQYQKAADLLRQLIEKGEPKNLDLIEVLLLDKQYKLALKEIEKLEESKGFAEVTDQFRDAIYKSTSRNKAAIKHYENRLESNPANESIYFRLISFYKLENNYDEILKVAKKLEKLNPLQDQLPFVLSMTYLELNQPEKAFEYSKSVFANNAINEDAKAQLVKSLKAFVEDNPTFQNTFIQLLNIAIDEGESSASNEEKGDFYLKRNSAKALEFYQKALEDQPNNFELYQKVIVLQIDQDLFEDALATSKLALEVFPSQAVFYFYKGKSLYRLTQYDEAISVLKEALAYVFETSQLEVDSLKLLSEAYTKQGKVEKANTYQEQAKKAKKKLDEMQ